MKTYGVIFNHKDFKFGILSMLFCRLNLNLRCLKNPSVCCHRHLAYGGPPKHVATAIYNIRLLKVSSYDGTSYNI